MKPVMKKEQYDIVLWLLVIAALCLIGLLVYFVCRVLTQPQVNGPLVMAQELFGKRGWL